MCDDPKKSLVPYTALSRRHFAQLATAASVLGVSGAAFAQGTVERDVKIRTADGECEGVISHPAGSGKHPGVLIWPDINGLRPAFRDMAKRLAAQGYTVLVVNPFYRSGDQVATGPGVSGEARNAMRALMTDDATARDAATFIDYLAAQPETSTARMGVQGYCMGGPLAFRTALTRHARIGAVGSFHGAGLTTDTPASPHLMIAKTRAQYVVAIAKNDDERMPTSKDILREAFAKSGNKATVEVFQGNHGWCVPDSAQYNAGEAERAWTELSAMYKAALV